MVLRSMNSVPIHEHNGYSYLLDLACGHVVRHLTQTLQIIRGKHILIQSNIKNGQCTVRFETWSEFSEFIVSEFIDYGHYVFRGQSDEKWPLEPSFDRLLKSINLKDDIDQMAFRHLSTFMKAVRGRRGSNPPKIDNEDDWWALGQHHGLATPLLDWSNSPFVASFFAFEGVRVEQESDVAVFALNVPAIVRKSDEIRIKGKTGKRPDHIIFVSPFSDENPRLINQAGLFSRTPYLVNIESWIEKYFRASQEAQLIKFVISKQDKALAIKALNRMNINHLSLFPDLSGASWFCNLSLGFKGYHFS